MNGHGGWTLPHARRSHPPLSLPDFERRGVLVDYQISLAPSGRWILERYGAKALENRQRPNVPAVLAVGDRNWLLRLALSAGGDLQVTSDLELATEIRETARLALANYQA